LREELTWLKQRFSVTDDDLLAALTPVEDDAVPLSIFVPELGVLEALAHHLVATRTLSEIARLLDRQYSTIASTVRNARRKSVAARSAAAAPLAPSNKDADVRAPFGKAVAFQSSEISDFPNPPEGATLSRKHSFKIPLRSPLRAAATDKSTFSSGEILIPLSIFRDRATAPLQALVKHLRENERMRFAAIARATGRDPRVISATYKEARR